MQIKELQSKQGKVSMEVEVKEIGDVREFQKFGNTGRVANATVADPTGTIKLTLWNEDIDKIRIGDKLKITDGFVSEFQGEKQLSAGRFGKLEVVGQKKK
ncbi:MAG: SOSS complex subunit B family protein [Nanoarchaeota archaeon]|nr:SOSS complex subunit B family protein [Nanoarchaeota archaeon]